jgi:uncharacterized protein (DUF1800 family)
MPCTRRDFIRNMTLLSAANGSLLLAGCKQSHSSSETTLSGTSIDAAQAAEPQVFESLPAPDRVALVLNRTSFGISQAEWDRANAIGIDAYLEEQLRPDSIDDPVASEIALRYPATQYSAEQLWSGEQGVLKRQLRDATLMRMCYSSRQLHEVVAEFWSNHFSVDARINPVGLFKLLDDREVIRTHALGRFRDLLYGTAKSAAMLRFLDNVSNTKFGPNENYARELMELHTIGIDGGYSEDDVREVARCFTGWQFDRVTLEFKFNANAHDDDEKTVLGHRIPAGQGLADGEQVLEILLAHPATGRLLARKLVRRFVSDNPPESLVTRVADVYAISDGDIPSMLREIFASAEFLSSADAKLKRPLEYVCSAIRILAPQIDDYTGPNVVAVLSTLGQVPLEWPTPDGYPDTAEHWLSALGMAVRWEFALQLAEQAPTGGLSPALALVGEANTGNELVDRLAHAILHRELSAEARRKLVEAIIESSYGPDGALPAAWLEQKAVLVTAVLMGTPYFMLR